MMLDENDGVSGSVKRAVVGFLTAKPSIISVPWVLLAFLEKDGRTKGHIKYMTWSLSVVSIMCCGVVPD
jgi:hypothetical protein